MRFLLPLFLILVFAFPAQAIETQFKVGQKYRDLIELKKDGEPMSVPLPEGEWIVTALGSRPTGRSGGTSTAADFGSRLIDVYLNRVENGIVTGGVTIRYPLDNDVSGWAAPKGCRRDGLNFSEENAYYSGTQIDCWYISFQPSTTKKSGTPFANSIKYLQELGAKSPVVFVYSMFYRANYGEFLRVGYADNPEVKGAGKMENAGSSRTADYYPQRIAEYPSKKKYMDGFIAWNKNWKKFVDMGFENELTLAKMGRTASSSSEGTPSNQVVSGTVEEKLKKLKSLEDAGLISKDEAASKRQEILKGL